MIPFPPLPAVVLLPFVALLGLAVDQTLLAIVIGALDVAIAFWLLGRLSVRPAVRNLLTVFVGAGTALWYAASLGSTWYFAHVVAVGLTLAAVGLALDADDHEAARDPAAPRPLVDGRQVAAGILLGLAATSRLTVAFGFPFLLLVGGGGGWQRRGLGAALGMAIPLAGLLAYTYAATGSLFNPVYEALYRYEVVAYPDLGYNAAWSLQDVRYIPQNLGLMLFRLPDLMPPCDPGVARSPWSAEGCSWLVPAQTGMSFLAASPAYLLALPSLALLRDRRVAGAILATLAIAVVNLMHFSQGWVQFGYRFSLDFAPFLLVAVALGTERFVASRGRIAERPSRGRGRPRGRLRGHPGVGHRLGPDARLVSAVGLDRRLTVGPAAGRAASWSTPQPRSSWGPWPSASPGACSCPARASGTPGSSSPCHRCWEPPIRPDTRAT